MIKTMLKALLVTIGLLSATLADAHHSGVAYDRSREVTVKGEVKEWRWSNPHAWLQMYVEDDNGEKILWSIESTSPNILVRQGWKRTSLKPGDTVEVVLRPMRDGTPGGSMIRAILSDGTVLGAPAGSGGGSASRTSSNGGSN